MEPERVNTIFQDPFGDYHIIHKNLQPNVGTYLFFGGNVAVDVELLVFVGDFNNMLPRQSSNIVGKAVAIVLTFFTLLTEFK